MRFFTSNPVFEMLKKDLGKVKSLFEQFEEATTPTVLLDLFRKRVKLEVPIRTGFAKLAASFLTLT